MVRVSIPEDYRLGFAILRGLEDDQVQELVLAIEEERPTRRRAGLYSRVASKVESIERSELDAMMDTLLSLFALRDELRLPTPEFIRTVSEAMEDSAFDELAFPDGESRESFEATLIEFLEIDNLEITAKAINLMYEQDHIVHGNPRVLTDMRPIFSSDPAEVSVRGAMVTYALKFEYHEGSRVEELSVALNAEQVDGLIDTLERARSKAENLEQLLRESGIRYVETD